MVKDSLSRSRRFKRNKFFKRLIFLTVSAVCVSGAIVGLLYIPFFRITTVAIENVKTVSSENLQNAADEFLHQKKWTFLPYNNFFVFLFNANALETILKEKFPKIKTIGFGRHFRRTITLRIEERKIWATLCKESSCFYVDHDGTLFGKSSRISGSVFFAIEDERIGVQSIHDTILPSEELSRIQTFLQSIESITNDSFQTLFISGSHNVIEKYEALTAAGWKIIFDSKTDTNTALANFLSAYEGLLKKDLNTIDYIDLRLENKIFYKYK